MSAADLGRGIEAGEIDPMDLASMYLDAIQAHPLRDKIYARLTIDRALEESRAASERAKLGLRRSPLDGVPISWKDLFDTAGVATEAGSALLEGRVPDRDAPVLRNATAAGLVCLGKTHMSELAFSGLGYNPVTATPPCVNDAEAVPGGSSSGAATSVAFGLAAGAVGSDTGGSVRIPSVWNDLVGLKTTHGRISLEGVVPLAESFDTVGPLCRTVEDCALMLAAFEGRKAPDLHGSSMRGKRLMVLETVAMEGVRAEPQAGFDHALERFEAAGAVIERRELPFVAEAAKLAPALFAPEGYAYWKDVIEAAPEKMYAEILERFRGGAKFSAVDHIRAWQELHRHRATWAEAVAGYDAVIIPTAPILPPKIAQLEADHDFYVTENLLTLRNTRIGNLMGLCALTLPTGIPSTGVMLMGLPGEEDRLLRLGMAAEAALT
ncbi:MAG: amidase [Rhodobacteraceae bacterium]|nr:amidase [Paracoccaceae bacterium]